MTQTRPSSSATLFLVAAVAAMLSLPRLAASSTLEERGTIALGDGVGAVALSAEGHRLAVADDKNHGVKIWDVRSIPPPTTGTAIALRSLPLKRTLTGPKQAVTALAFSRDGSRLASGGTDGVIRLWDCASGRLRQTLAGHEGPIFLQSFSPDGTLLASAGRDNTARVWEVATGKLLATLTGHTGEVNALAFSPAGDALATAGADADIKLWQARTGKLQQTFTDLQLATLALVFSADGKTLLAGGVDKTISFLDVATGKIQKRLTGSSDAITCLALAAGDRFLVSGGINVDSSATPTSLQVWDLDSGQAIQRLPRPAWVPAADVSANGKLVLSCAGSGGSQTATVWEVR